MGHNNLDDGHLSVKNIETGHSDYIGPVGYPLMDESPKSGFGEARIFRQQSIDNGLIRDIPQAHHSHHSPKGSNNTRNADGISPTSHFSAEDVGRRTSPRFLVGGPSSPRFMKEPITRISPPPPPPGRLKRFWAHVKRHWVLYLIGNLILHGIVLIIFFLAILPAIVQHLVSSNELPIIYSALTAPTPDNITISLTTKLESPNAISSHMDAQMLGLYNAKNDPHPFLEVPIPAQKLKGTTHIVVTNVTRPILNETTFSDFLRNSLNTRNFTIYIKSKTTIHLTSSLHYDVTINKGIKVPGLNKLAGFSVNSVGLSGGGLDATVIIPNASPFALELGNVTQNLYAGTTRLGTGLITNFVLYPFRNSTLPLISTVDTSTAIQNFTQIISSQAGSLASGMISLTTTGNKTEYNGVEIPYLEAAMSDLRLTTEISLSQVAAGVNASLGNSSLAGDLGSLLNNSSIGGLLNGANGTAGGSATGLTGLLGLLSPTSIQQGLQGIMSGIQAEAGNNSGGLGGLLSGLSGMLSGLKGGSSSKVKRIDVLTDDTVLMG